MSRNTLYRADRDRASSKFSNPVTPIRPSTKKRTYSTDSSGGSSVGVANFRSTHPSPRKRLSLQHEPKINLIKGVFATAPSSSDSADSSNEATDGGNEGDDDDDDDDYSGVNDFPIEDLTGENDTEETKLDISDVLFGSQIFGEYHESVWTIYDDMDSPAYRTNGHARQGSLSTEKRVRFEEVFLSASSSTASSDTGDIPDLFMNPQDLPAAIRNTWDRSPTPSVVASEDGSYWDFQGSGTETVVEHESPFSPTSENFEESDSDESGDCDDEDDDDDDETDEEDVEVVLRRWPPRSRTSPVSRPTTPNSSRSSRRPIQAEMPLDDDKEYATTINGKVVHFKSPRVQIMLRDIRASRGLLDVQNHFLSFLQDDNIATDISNSLDESDMIATGGDLNTMFGAHGGLTNFVDVSSSVLAPSAPLEMSISERSPSTSTMSYEGTLQSDDSEDESYRLEDFIDVGEDDGQNSDVEFDDCPPSPTPSTIAQQRIETPKSMSLNKVSKSGILDHLDKSKVGSFRNHQDIHRRLSSFGPDPAQRVSASTPIRPGKSADLLTTPVRRRANSNSYRKFGRAAETAHMRQKRGSGSFSRNH